MRPASDRMIRAVFIKSCRAQRPAAAADHRSGDFFTVPGNIISGIVCPCDFPPLCFFPSIGSAGVRFLQDASYCSCRNRSDSSFNCSGILATTICLYFKRRPAIYRPEPLWRMRCHTRFTSNSGRMTVMMSPFL